MSFSKDQQLELKVFLRSVLTAVSNFENWYMINFENQQLDEIASIAIEQIYFDTQTKYEECTDTTIREVSSEIRTMYAVEKKFEELSKLNFDQIVNFGLFSSDTEETL
ncbi:hypothetical protein AN214_03104 [Pseudoalteromonas sp. P1-9]|uniref:hypothetical protein n=1 Tax=Pseudoalteromonas sp. P1-9 TaxID=1710354 RepID=UPI0006D609B0|nr:hypothetical protein [Pseudoalteromonas sp. P1-9]KPV94803.1 hypothetical protein AN214_03104 [Pseudoalteromonas sp. P1-9]